jgi:hypothetical protein
MPATREQVFNQAARICDDLRRADYPENLDLPIHSFALPSVALALERNAKKLPPKEAAIVTRAAKILTPPFWLARRMIVESTCYNIKGAETVFITISGDIDGPRIKSQHKIKTYNHPQFPVSTHPENSRHDGLWIAAEAIRLQIELTRENTRIAAETRLEMMPDGNFSYAHTEILGKPADTNTIGATDCILRTLSTPLTTLLIAQVRPNIPRN